MRKKHNLKKKIQEKLMATRKKRQKRKRLRKRKMRLRLQLHDQQDPDGWPETEIHTGTTKEKQDEIGKRNGG